VRTRKAFPVKFSKNPFSNQVAEYVKEQILDGSLEVGQKLPSERKLSEEIGVGRLSIREGLRKLESVGIVKTVYGVNSGSYVCQIDSGNITENLVNLLRFSSITIEQLTEARLGLAPVILKRFIRFASKDAINELESCLEGVEKMLTFDIKRREKSINFHRLIGEGSNNPILIFMNESILEIFQNFISRFTTPIYYSKKILEHNKEILKYIREKNEEKASKAMENHIIYLNKILKRFINEKDSILLVEHKLQQFGSK